MSASAFTVIGTIRKTKETERKTFISHVIAEDCLDACRAAAKGIKDVLPYAVSVKTEIVTLGHIEPFEMEARVFTETKNPETKEDTRCLHWWSENTKVSP